MSSSNTPVRPRRRVALALAALTLTALGASTVEAPQAAAAGRAKVRATVHLAPGKAKLVGRVKSPRAACRKGTKVRLFWQVPGSSGFVRVATDRTNDRGVWSIHAPGRRIPSGRYYVKVTKTKRCKPAKSPTTRVG